MLNLNKMKGDYCIIWDLLLLFPYYIFSFLRDLVLVICIRIIYIIMTIRKNGVK